jgi:hypothetical protein
MSEETRREFLEMLPLRAYAGATIADVVFDPDDASAALNIVDHPSPKQKQKDRIIRNRTDYIILHTTEALGDGPLNKLTTRGEANYMVQRSGRVLEIMKRHQISRGSGVRSMWNGVSDLDPFVVNIEFEGYHHQDITPEQYNSGKELIEYLRGFYTWIDDHEVMPHSQVAFGRPHKWQHSSHRGRKLCGLLFARDDVRAKLGLHSKPEYDPDVMARRLVVGDPVTPDQRKLVDALYGSFDEPIVVASKEIVRPPETDITDDDTIFHVIQEGETAWTYAGNEFDHETTTYWLKLPGDGRIRRGDEIKEYGAKEGIEFDNLRPGTMIAVGYVYAGHVNPSRPAWDSCKTRCYLPSTVYISDGEMVTGDEVDFSTIQPRTLVLFKK